MVTNSLKPSDFKEWLWSAKVLTTIVWILFPLGYITIRQILNLPSWGPFNPEPIHIFLGGVIFDISSDITYNIVIPPIPLIVVLFLFSLIPAIYPTEKFFKRRGCANAVIEYQYFRKILFGYLITLVVLVPIVYFLVPFSLEQLRNLHAQGLPFIEARDQLTPLFTFMDTLYLTVFVFLDVSIFILLKLLLERARKQFGFYYAKSCFEIIRKTDTETDRTEYFALSLGWYNKFVKKVTKSGIDIETIYSKIILHSQLSNNTLLDTIMESFYGDDELKPMRHILALLSCWKEGATLVKESLRTKVRESSDLLIPIVTVVITIITTFYLEPPT